MNQTRLDRLCQPRSWIHQKDVRDREAILRWIAVGSWSLVALLVTLKCSFKPYSHAVFPAYAQAGRTWFDRGTERPDYVEYLQRQYSPFFSVLIEPFDDLPIHIGGLVWSWCGLIVFATGFLSLLPRFLPKENFEPNRSIAMIAVPWFGIASLLNGQVNTLMAGCMMWATIFLLDKQYARASLCLALPIAIKTYPLALAGVFAALLPRKLVVWLAISVAFLLALPWLIYPSELVAERFLAWLSFLASGEHAGSGYVTLDFRAFLDRWLVSLTPAEFTVVQATTGLLVLAIAVWIERQPKGGIDQAIRGGYLLTSVWLVLFGPATEEATYLLAAPALAIATPQMLNQFRNRHALLALFVSAILVAGPLQTSILGEAARKWIFAQKLAPLGALILFLFILKNLVGSVMPAAAVSPAAACIREQRT